jgi:hypothetical protein
VVLEMVQRKKEVKDFLAFDNYMNYSTRFVLHFQIGNCLVRLL